LTAAIKPWRAYPANDIRSGNFQSLNNLVESVLGQRTDNVFEPFELFQVIQLHAFFLTKIAANKDQEEKCSSA
jgi:hypothetical protein